MNMMNIFGDKPWKRKLTYANLLYTVGIIIAGPAWPLALIDKITGRNDLARIIGSLPQDEDSAAIEEIEYAMDAVIDLIRLLEEEEADKDTLDLVSDSMEKLLLARTNLRNARKELPDEVREGWGVIDSDTRTSH